MPDEMRGHVASFMNKGATQRLLKTVESLSQGYGWIMKKTGLVRPGA